ncbi:hypothetical protein A2Y99_02045 [Candidatus Gottesmanbacteria bacterium RBG_13_37_7]|uniref:Uncharacterized protein n=1 Tax=Candidatus Gottesmanbacteria bacterium RBG_13_37_7 TaxID=1798369 RepID=A0A1F5YHT9_9BACT|nr:MAG: hypothetical protein A2Y99_02045 [Candidatus Gottesmanbacteria bacterium RBG_13_37_7]
MFVGDPGAIVGVTVIELVGVGVTIGLAGFTCQLVRPAAKTITNNIQNKFSIWSKYIIKDEDRLLKGYLRAS